MLTRLRSRSLLRTITLISLASLFVTLALWRVQRAHATSFTSTQSGTWGNAATWGGAGVPGCGDAVTIANTHTVTLNSNVGGLGCNFNLTINNGGTLDLGGFQFENSGNNVTFTNNGTFANSGAFNRMIFANGGANFTLAGNGTYSSNLKLENFSVVWHIAANTSFTFNSAANNINIQIDNGTLDVGNPLVIIAPSAGSNYVILDQQGGDNTGSSIIQTQGNVRLRQTGGPKIHIPVETVSGASQGDGYFGKGWTVDTGASLSLSGNLTVSNNDGGSGLIIQSGASLDLAGNQMNIAFNGPFTNNGTVNNSGAFSHIVFMDNGVHAVSGTGTYSGNVGLELLNNNTNISAGSSLTFGTPAGNTNIQVDSGANLNFTGSGSLTLSGQVLNNGALNMNSGGPTCADASKILIRSSVAGTQRSWTGNAMTLVNVDVKDQAGTAAVTVSGGVDSGNNGANWTFSAACALPDVSVAVSPSSVAEDGATNLVYTFTRTGSTTSALTVNFSVGGTATFSTDYTQTGAATFSSSSGTVTFGAGNSTATVTLDPTADSTVESDETAILTVTSGTGYNVGSPSTATGTITNDDTDVTVAVSPSSVVEDGGTNLVYTFSRNGVTSGALTANFSVGGTATFNTDYTQSGAATFSSSSGTVTFGAGNSTATVTLDPTADSTVESDETAILTVTSGTGYNVGSPSAATGTITNDDSTPLTIQFSAAVYSVGEGDNRVDTTITRLGDASGPASVSFATSDLAGTQNCNIVNGAASERCDYETRLTTVNFASGETSKTVSVFIIDDSYLEGPETFTVSLSSPSGASLGTPAAATVTITDNDSADGPNPIDVTAFFVRMHYLDFLNREPDGPGGAFWINNIDKCSDPSQRPPDRPTLAGCIDRQRETTSGAFFLSDEFQLTGYFVYLYYTGALNRVPTYREFERDAQEVANGVVVNNQWSPTVLNQNRAAYAQAFIARAEFQALYDGLTNRQYVDKLFQTTGIQATENDKASLAASLNNSTDTRATALHKVVEGIVINGDNSKTFTTPYGQDYYLKQFNAGFVQMEYFGYLRRAPDASGYQHWKDKLDFYSTVRTGNYGTYLTAQQGEYIKAEMVRAFIVSDEYRRRFGPQPTSSAPETSLMQKLFEKLSVVLVLG